MKELRNISISHVIWLLIFAFYVLTVLAPFIFPIESRLGGGILSGLLVIILIFGLIKNNSKIAMSFTLYHYTLLFFSLFCLLSSTWALDKELAFLRSMDLIKVSVGMFIIYYCIEREKNATDNLLKCIMWSGYIIAVYSLFAYGWSGIVDVISSSDRLANDVINANVIGMSVAYSLLINVTFFLYKREMAELLPLAMLSAIILIASGSRKGFSIFVFGMVMLSLCRSFGNGNIIKKVIKIIISFLTVLVLLFFFMKLHIFSGMEERMAGLVAGLTGYGVVDYSTMIRFRLISIGQDIIKDNFYIGVGINNSIVVVEQILGRSNYYLHNNYMELLADVGVIGTTIYYIIYIAMLLSLIKHRRFSTFDYDICISMLVIYIVMDFGAVTYNNKYTYIILMYFWLATKKNKKLYLLQRNMGEM